MGKKIVEVIVNKSWEFEPFFNALVSTKLRAEGLPLPDVINQPVPGEVMYLPRALYNSMNITIGLRCVENMMDPTDNPSNSQAKLKYMPEIIRNDHPNIVISVSTAESTPDIMNDNLDSINGSVLIGGNFYMFDARKFNPTQPSPSQLNVAGFQKNSINDSLYNLISPSFSKTVVSKFIPQKNARATEMRCIANPKYASVGVVNIVEYGGYKKGDPAAYNEFVLQLGNSDYIPVSIETTHGIVKMAAGTTPTLFVSPITDRYEHFDDDVDAVQYYIAAFNAGIAVGELLMQINKNPNVL